jgi:VIT1/CCC1 family predicted Fe2+/Mn2+ transporter
MIVIVHHAGRRHALVKQLIAVIGEVARLARKERRMNTALWALQGVLALAFTGAGLLKLTRTREALVAQPKMAWAGDFSAGQIKSIGLAEVLGALGLVLPVLLGLPPVLTPIAAAGLTLLMAGAVVTHVRRGEPAVPPAVLGLLSLAVVVGRTILA